MYGAHWALGSGEPLKWMTLRPAPCVLVERSMNSDRVAMFL
jgi:hypothetical protein